MIDKDLYINSHSLKDIIDIATNLHDECNIGIDLYNSKIRTIQFMVDDKVFCEYEFDEIHGQLTHLTPDGREKVLLTIGEFIKSVREEMEKMDDVVYYYLSRK